MLPRGRRAQLLVTLLACVSSVIWAALVGQVHLHSQEGALARLDSPLLDLRFRLASRPPAPAEVVIVAIDDAAMAAARAFPYPRDEMARLITAISAASPRAVAVDSLFLDPGRPEADEALATALASGPTTIAGAALFSRQAASTTGKSGLDALPRAEGVLSPEPGLARNAPVGMVNLVLDSGGTPRLMPLLLAGPAGEPLPSLVLRAVSIGRSVVPRFDDQGVAVEAGIVPLDIGWSLPLRYYGPRGTLTTISASTVSQGTLPPQTFRNRVVFVGTTATGAGDRFATPYDPVMPGVEVLATAAANLLTGSTLVRSAGTRTLDAVAGLAIALASVCAVMLAPLPIGIPIVVALLLLWMGGAFLAFAEGYWLNTTLPLIVALPGVLLCVLARHVIERRTQQGLARSHAALGRLQPDFLVQHLVSDPDWLITPVEQHLVILFVDLSGFTNASETLGAQRARGLLDRFHAVVEGEVASHGGMVLGFLGDGAMAVFGLAENARAAEAALIVSLTLTEGGGPLADAVVTGEIPLRTRAGVHAGPVVLSRFGADGRQHINVTGDVVNTASRLLDIAKDLDARVVASARVIDEAGGAPGSGTWLGPYEAMLRGRTHPIVVRYLPWTTKK
jgi:adenylate cyclase